MHFWEKNKNKIQVCSFFSLLLGLACLHFLLNVSKMWLANLLTTIFTKKMSDLIWTHSIICMWHVPCVVRWALFENPLHHVYSNSWVPDVPHCLMKHVGASLRGKPWRKWYVSWAMIRSRHIEGGLASQDSLHHIDVEKCALWALYIYSGKSCT